MLFGDSVFSLPNWVCVMPFPEAASLPN